MPEVCERIMVDPVRGADHFEYHSMGLSTVCICTGDDSHTPVFLDEDAAWRASVDAS